MFILNKINVISCKYSLIAAPITKMLWFCSFKNTLIVSTVEFSQLEFHAVINMFEFKHNFVVGF